MDVVYQFGVLWVLNKRVRGVSLIGSWAALAAATSEHCTKCPRCPVNALGQCLCLCPWSQVCADAPGPAPGTRCSSVLGHL